jgi:CubicO group peptidase (beta-lactamase class C family)
MVTFCHSVQAQKKTVDAKTHYAEEVLKPYVESGQLPGAISVFYKDGVQETCCIGYADVESKRKIGLESSFMQCSQTKGFCGVTIAKLVEEGKISLDDPVSKYLHEFKTLWVQESEKDGVKVLRKAKNVLTIRMVMNHTGGFPFEISAKRGDVRGGGWSGGAPIRQVASIAAASPLLFEPGTNMKYSNTGIDIGAAIIEVVTGKPWDVFLNERVLMPLDMKNTTFNPSDEQLKNAMSLYIVRAGKKAEFRAFHPAMPLPHNGPDVHPSAGAGLWTTANDQLKFYKMLMNLGMGDNGVRILKKDTVKNLLATSFRPAKLGKYSLGLNVDGKGGFGHGGAWGTRCTVNWKTKQLQLKVVQIIGKSSHWNKELNLAAKKFFTGKFDTSGSDAYTGRLK